MITTRCVNFRLYPNRQQNDQLHYWRRLHASLYNAAVSNRKTQHQKFGHSVDYFEQQNCLPAFKEVWPEYKELGSHALQATLKRVDFAFTRFFRGLGGYPRFKSELCGGSFPRKRRATSRHYSGWTYPCNAGWKALSDGGNGYLNISKLGKVQMRGQARTWGKSTTCTIFYRNGKWYVSITVQCQPSRETSTGSVGIDLGCKEAITLSTGEQIAKPEFIKEGQKKVKAASKKLRRKRAPNRKKKIKASRRWKKERKNVSKLQRKVTRQREDWVHQTTSNIVSGNSLVGGEQLNVKGMTAKAKKRTSLRSGSVCRESLAGRGLCPPTLVRTRARAGKRTRQKAGLNRSILEVGFGMIGQMLNYKLAEAGGFYVESPTRTLKPTQRCAKCWELTPKTLADRMHICCAVLPGEASPGKLASHCSHTEDRDINAAQVNLIWARGRESASLSAEPSTSISCGSMKQVGALKRLKPFETSS